MNKPVSLELDDHFARFVAGQIADGHYGSASEVVLAGLRLLEDRQSELAALRAALVEGEESGPATPFDFDAFIAGRRGAAQRATVPVAE